MNISSKYAIYILPLLLILLFAGTASALPTVAHDKVQGEMYVSSTANWPSTYSTNNFEVPNGTVVFARYYVGVWGAGSSLNAISTTFNGHAYEINPSYYSSDMGVTWIPYDITDYVLPGETNTATIDSSKWGDGRQYGSTLVVVLENKTNPQVEYWVAESLDWLHYGDFVGYEVNDSITYFNGTVDLADVQSASLYSTHLTGYNYEDFNGKSLSDPAKSVSGEYFNYIRWDNVKDSLVAENQTVNVRRGDDTYCSPVFHALSIIYEKPNLVPVSLKPDTVVPETDNTMTATVENQGNKDSTTFNVSFLVDGTVVDTQTVASLASGSSTTVEFHWTPDSTKDSYTLAVEVDPENAVSEEDENNNSLTSLVGTTTAQTPIANFTATPTNGDAPLPVEFIDTSINSPTSWAWDFGDENASNEQNPTHTYNIPGTYNVTLTVTNAKGNNSETKTNYIVINPPTAEFNATPLSGGAPLTVNFTDQSTGTPTSWAWDFGDGSTSTENNPTHIYSTPGTYTVSLTVTNVGGTNSTVKTGYITVSTIIPLADFTAAPTTGTTPLAVQFTDQSAYTPTNWLWNFGDGTISTKQNPAHTYTNIGTYTVKLTATNIVGNNTATKIGYITVSGIGPVWTAKSEWNTPDTGSYASPCLVDLDSDGDDDLLIGESYGISYAYENTGNASSPVWKAKSEWNAPDVGTVGVPCTADLDGDGDYDLLIGEKYGVSYAYENTGNTSSPVWKAKSEWNAPDIGNIAGPAFADLDSDGDYDLLIGAYNGVSYGYENTGNITNPVWTAKSEWNINVGVNPSNPKLAFSDLDDDGDYDLLIGLSTGVSYSYENTGNITNPVWIRKTAWDPSDIGSQASPCFGDLDDDGDYDLLIGEKSGITYGYENTAALESSSPDLGPTDITLPSIVNVGTPCTATVTVNNTGTADVEAFTASLSVNGTAVDTQSMSGISTDSSALVNFTWTPTTAGDYNLTVTVDPENEITESDETNNDLTITVTSSEAPTSPDTTNPVIDSVVLFPANTTAGSTISISANITDDVEVTEVTAGEIQLTKTDGIWQASITAPSSLGDYSLSINATDAAGNIAETSIPYHVVQLSGGANIAVSPRASSAAAGNTVTLAVKVKNTQNVDDIFKVSISVSELPASYQTDLSWFNWTEKVVTLKAGEEILVPVEVTVPDGTAAGRKLFRATVNSEKSSITGFDTGYLVIS